jgi:hypothetical protein
MLKYLSSGSCGLAAAALILLAALPANAEWTGSEVTKDGVIHVMNPSAPTTSPITEKAARLWGVGGDEEDDVLFGLIVGVAVDGDGLVYLLDSQINVVHVFSPEGEFLREIGREGEGPGEFRRPEDMFLTGQGNIAIMQGMPGKIVQLSPEGDPLGNYPLPEQDDGGMMMLGGGAPAGDQVVLSSQDFVQGETGFSVISKLIRVNSAGRVTATYNESTTARDMANFDYDERRDAQALFATTTDGRVFVHAGWDEYAINAYDPGGALERVIEREFTPRKRNDEELEDNKPRAFMQSDEGTREIPAVVSPTDRSVRGMYARPDGSLWVISSRGAGDNPEGTMGVFDVFDAKGRFVQQITIEGDANFTEDNYYFAGDRLVLVKGYRASRRAMFADLTGGEDGEDEDVEPLSVVCYDLSRIVRAGK